MPSYDTFVIAALLEECAIKREDLDNATRLASERGIGVPEALEELKVVRPRDIALVRASICEYPYVDPANYVIDIRNAAKVPRSVAERYLAFPLFDLGRVVTVGMADPLDLNAVDQFRSLLKTEIEPVLCAPEALRELIARAYSLNAGGSGTGAPAPALKAVELTTGDEPMVAAVNQIIAQAIDEGASDIHLGPDERNLHVRYRIDGALQERQGPGLSAHTGLVQRLKVMAHLDLTVTRRPQDGKFRFTLGTRTADIRLSVIPTVTGENVVMRLLAAGRSIGTFEDLGFPAEARKQFERLIDSPYGMLLATGPTGSGKTTTLYTALKRLNSPDVNIVTIEDPVEIRMPLIRQVQVNSEIGMTFASALRSILRQDPDIVLVGEIRDEETARIAVQSALTGHLVLSTLHTNDAAGAVARLRDFGCPPFAINASLLAVIAQRLVRRACQECAAPHEPTELMLARFGLKPGQAKFVSGAGCPKCMSSGYKGRLCLFELLTMKPELQEAIERAEATGAIHRVAIEHGMRPMWMDGLDKARLGLTTLDEVTRVAAVQLTDCAEGSKPAPTSVPQQPSSDEMRLSA